MNLIPNINSKTFTLSATIIGYILLDDSTPAEQNSLGNWFMLIGQILCTNSAQQQVINNRTNQSNQTNEHTINSNKKNNNQNETNPNQKSNVNQDDINNQIKMIKKVIDAMQKEINNLKNI